MPRMITQGPAGLKSLRHLVLESIEFSRMKAASHAESHAVGHGGSAMRPLFQGSIVALVTPFRNGAGGRDQAARPRRVPREQRHRRHRALRHHRRVAHPQPRRAQARGGDRGRGRGRSAGHHRGDGLQLDGGGHRAHAPRQAGRRHRGPRWSIPTTTSPPRRVSTGTSARSRSRWTSRSSVYNIAGRTAINVETDTPGAARQATVRTSWG